eukprot:353774-Chlamydomonas_euryale.AAC.6
MVYDGSLSASSSIKDVYDVLEVDRCWSTVPDHKKFSASPRAGAGDQGREGWNASLPALQCSNAGASVPGAPWNDTNHPDLEQRQSKTPALNDEMARFLGLRNPCLNCVILQDSLYCSTTETKDADDQSICAYLLRMNKPRTQQALSSLPGGAVYVQPWESACYGWRGGKEGEVHGVRA